MSFTVSMLTAFSMQRVYVL